MVSSCSATFHFVQTYDGNPSPKGNIRFRSRSRSAPSSSALIIKTARPRGCPDIDRSRAQASNLRSAEHPECAPRDSDPAMPFPGALLARAALIAAALLSGAAAASAQAWTCVRSCEDKAGSFFRAQLAPNGMPRCLGKDNATCSWYIGESCDRLTYDSVDPVPGQGFVCPDTTGGWCRAAAWTLIEGHPQVASCYPLGPWRCIRSCGDKGNYLNVRNVGFPYANGTVQCLGPTNATCSWFSDSDCTIVAPGESEPNPLLNTGVTCPQPSAKGSWCELASEYLFYGTRPPCPGDNAPTTTRTTVTTTASATGTAAATPAELPGARCAVLFETFRTPQFADTGFLTVNSDACLTATGRCNMADVAWNNTLQLTAPTTSNLGGLMYNRAIPTRRGIQVTVDVAMYNIRGKEGQQPADGMSFFLFDGSVLTPSLGTPGGQLAYANVHNANGQTGVEKVGPGVRGAVLGIGLDTYGFFNRDNVKGGTGGDCPADQRSLTNDIMPNSIAVRGPAFNTAGTKGYCWLAAQPLNTTMTVVLSPPFPEELPLQARFTVPVDGNVTVELNFRDYGAATKPGWTTVLSVRKPADLPPTLKFGFGASTGWFFQGHALRNLDVQSIGSCNDGVSSTTAVPSATAAIAAVESSQASSANIGAIVGGVVGGLAGLTIIGALLFFLAKRNKARVAGDDGPKDGDNSVDLGELGAASVAAAPAPLPAPVAAAVQAPAPAIPAIVVVAATAEHPTDFKGPIPSKADADATAGEASGSSSGPEPSSSSSAGPVPADVPPAYSPPADPHLSLINARCFAAEAFVASAADGLSLEVGDVVLVKEAREDGSALVKRITPEKEIVEGVVPISSLQRL
ncbi:hypothetical protein DFJ74DRAFT_663200 [Hyaloraphidium curvatum]|nr:hypothetical protein DFJ74DRAFT_663200 [Hyaloraphidium curvatum]